MREKDTEHQQGNHHTQAEKSNDTFFHTNLTSFFSQLERMLQDFSIPYKAIRWGIARCPVLPTITPKRLFLPQ